MPAGVPPKDARPQPVYHPLPAGSRLWTVTPRSALADGSPFRRPPTELEMQGARWGGRFDPTPDCPYPYCYAAFDDLTALGEALLRDVRMDAPVRYLPRRSVAGRSLVLLETVRPLWLISLLNGPDLSQVRQDVWLVHAESRDYPRTQLWAHWLRESPGPDGAGPPAGLMWPSKRQPSGQAVLFFGDRCADAVIRSPSAEPARLDGADHAAWLERRLSVLRTRLGPPPDHPPAHASDS